jgi:hypothetical protein
VALNVLNNENKNIISIRFTSTQTTLAVFDAEILLDVDTQTTAIGKITYEINDAEVTNYYPTETWIDGKHVLRLLYFITITSARSFKFVVKLNMSGGSASIPIENIKAAIHGQGLLEIGDWDGYLDFRETIEEIDLSSVTVENNIVDTFTLQQDIPHRPSFTETLGEVTLNGILLENNFGELLLVNKDAMSNYRHQQLTPYTHEDLRNGFIHG